MRGLRRWLAMAVMLTVGPGCVGHGGVELVAEGELLGPVSLTPAVLDEDGEALWLGAELESVGPFEAEHTFWAVFLIGLGSSAWDITELVNETLTETGGEAIVDVDIELKPCGITPYLHLIPVLPSCVRLILRGDVGARPSVPWRRVAARGNPVEPGDDD